jgi:hypothetical protein
MRGVPPVPLPEHARDKLIDLQMQYDATLDAMRSCATRIA